MVQQFREREVQVSAQTPGYQNVQFSPDAFGAGIGRALGQLGDSIQSVGEMYGRLQKEKKANDTLNYVASAKDELRPWLFDPSDGIYSKQGGQAMGVGEQGKVVLDNIQKKYLEQIKDPEVADAFRKAWLQESDQVNDSVARHELNQLGTYQTETVKGTLASAVQDAYTYYNDDKALEKALSDTRRAIAVNSAGAPPEILTAAEKEAVSQVHLAALSRWAGEDPYKALDYFQTHKDEMSGKDLVTGTALVEAAKNNRQAQEFVATESQTSPGGARLWTSMEAAESSGNTQAESPVGASGVMQVMPDTAREVDQQLGLNRLVGKTDDEVKAILKANPDYNRTLGRTYMSTQLKTYNGDLEAALVAYNAGPGSADAFLKHNAGKLPGQRSYDVPGWPKLKSETEGYVQKITGQMGLGGTPVGQRMTPANWGLKNFRPQDILAPTAGGQWVDARAAQGLDSLADRMKGRFPGFQIKINEEPSAANETAGRRRGTADPKDNPHVQNSQHIHGTAFDVQWQGWSQDQKIAFIQEARALGFGGIGFYGDSGHIHIDMGNTRTWGATPGWAAEAMKTPVGQVPRGVASAASSGDAPGVQVASASGELPASGALNSVLGGGTAAANYYMPTSGFDLQAALEKAQLIADPNLRARTESLLRLEGTRSEQQQKEAEARAKQGAWQTVLQGSVKDLSPDQLATLEPGFVNSLYAYEAKRAEGGVQTDWTTWSQVSLLPEKELREIDPMDYRTRLGDTEFKQLVTLVQSARGDSGTGDEVLKNMRSRSDIIQDTFTQLGIDAFGAKASSTNKAFLAEFNRKFGERLTREQQVKGSQLTEPEMQDIADKLLIQDNNTWFGKGTRAAKIEDPSQFIAASNWQEVQEDDQNTLINAYEQQFNQTPTQEVATDLYNRAMRFWLGAKPELTEEETKIFVDYYKQKTGGQTPPDSWMEQKSGQYLSLFLGR